MNKIIFLILIIFISGMDCSDSSKRRTHDRIHDITGPVIDPCAPRVIDTVPVEKNQGWMQIRHPEEGTERLEGIFSQKILNGHTEFHYFSECGDPAYNELRSLGSRERPPFVDFEINQEGRLIKIKEHIGG